jgi:hypothetical protein
MNFMNAMQNEMLENFNHSVTENGAVGYRTTGKNLLDINFAVASLRSASEDEIVASFKSAFLEDKILAMKWLFFARDIRGGLGERRLFRTAMSFVADYEPAMIKKVIPLIPEYGRFDDMWSLLNNKALCPTVMEYIKEQLEGDIRNCSENKPVSLLAKWLPSCNASSADSKKYSRIIRQHLDMTERAYRKMLSRLRKYIDVVEIKMSAKQWGEINYEAVPSRANLIYNDAFLRNDESRRREFLNRLEKGEAKINAGTLFPHDIVHKYTNTDTWNRRKRLKAYDATIEALWENLPDMVDGCGNTIVVADGSGSMTVPVGNTSTTALEVANALAIYFAERSSGEFKDKYITFSSHPQLVDFSCGENLRDKISIALSHNEVSNTDIEAVFDLILSTALRNNMRQEDIPANILIISDMEFDCATACRTDVHLFKSIEAKYKANGYKLPRLVFWNVNSRTNTVPVRENDMGVALVSGFSVNICKMVMSGKTDPFECLLETLNSERYQPVEDALRGE